MKATLVTSDGTKVLDLNGEQEWLTIQFPRRIKGLIQHFPMGVATDLTLTLDNSADE